MDEVELGYRLRQECWSKRYATEGSKALPGKAFPELDVRLVRGATMFRNLASQKVMEKVGMTLAEAIPTPEDMMKVERSELGGLQYQIVKEQWEQQEPGRNRRSRRTATGGGDGPYVAGWAEFVTPLDGRPALLGGPCGAGGRPAGGSGLCGVDVEG